LDVGNNDATAKSEACENETSSWVSNKDRKTNTCKRGSKGFTLLGGEESRPKEAGGKRTLKRSNRPRDHSKLDASTKRKT